MSSLKQALYDEYGFADKRYKKLTSSETFPVDGRSESDIASDGSFYGWFCMIFVDSTNEPILQVSFYKNIPIGPLVEQWIKTNSASYSTGQDQQLEFTVESHDFSKLLGLASAIEDITKPGNRYNVSSYKYQCPRIGAAMRRLHAVLSTQWP